jgi:hypothetical protein
MNRCALKQQMEPFLLINHCPINSEEAAIGIQKLSVWARVNARNQKQRHHAESTAQNYSLANNPYQARALWL